MVPNGRDEDKSNDDTLEHIESPLITGEVAQIGILAALPILLLFPTYMLSHPYWVDEGPWVAVASRAPISKLLLVTSSTPIGWTILMVLVPGPGDQRQRMLPLAFAVGTVVFAYLFARDLRWPTPAGGRIAGTVTAIFVAIAPIALLRQDLKQYTADACLTLMIVWLVVRLESTWSAKRLWTLVAISVIGSLVSYASMFVVAAAIVSLIVVAALRGNRQRVAGIAIAGAAIAVGFAIVAALFILPHVSESLAEYWAGFYLDPADGMWQIWKDIWQRFDKLAPLLGLRWPLLTIGFTFIGIVVIGQRGRRASSFILPVLYVEMIALGILGKYPFLDQRTSHFLLILTIAVAAIGIAGVATELHQRWETVGSIVLVVLMALGFYAASPYVGSRSIPNENVRAQTQYVEENIQLGDVILVSAPGSWGFAYYWQRDDPLFVSSDKVATGFGIDYDQHDIVVAPGRTIPDIENALDTALRAASRPHASGRIWLIRSHVIPDESVAWAVALERDDLSTDLITKGSEPLALITILPSNDT